MKKYALLAAIVFIASSAGIASAYFGNTPPEFETREEMIEYKKASMGEHLDQLVADGKITQEQANEKNAWMEKRTAERQENCPEGDPLFKRDGTRGKGMKIRSLK